MKRQILSVAALSAVMLAAGFSFGHAQTNKQPAQAPAEKPQKLVLVASLKGAQLIHEFESNVQVMQNERNSVLQLSKTLQDEKNPQKKKELQAKLDAAMTKLNEDNDKMIKTYGFTIARNYIMEVTEAKVYAYVTDEEAAKIEKADAEKQKAKK